ncbi:hypothetical protein BC829DRAFT_381279 [Chytridium lagenaria]|nr:hypothetical protein BC829DRAFT_381279 [Chytridium lagenaria]
MASQSQFLDLPIIDISPFSNAYDEATIEDARKDTCAAEMLAACEAYGAFAIVGHPAKSAIPIQPGGFTRGYVGVGGESGSSALEVKEAFSYGYEWNDNEMTKNPLQGPNLFPESMAADGKQLLQQYSIFLLKWPNLVEKCKGGETISLMRMFKYYPYDQHGGAAKEDSYVPDVDRIGSSAHTDWGYLTLISSKTPGLQIALKDSGALADRNTTTKWATVNPVNDAFIVNAGDYLSLVTNGRIRSPLHRVVTASAERLSFVFFYYPSYDAKLSVDADSGSENGHLKELSLFKDQRQAPQLGQESLVERIASMSFGQYISEKWASVFRQSNANGPQQTY